MNKGLSAKQIKAIDQYTIESIGMPSLVLMERAALASAEAIMVDFDFKSAFILCGTGNNGGDGIAVGRLLHQAGKSVTLCIVGNLEHASEETTVQLRIAKNLNVPCVYRLCLMGRNSPKSKSMSRSVSPSFRLALTPFSLKINLGIMTV